MEGTALLCENCELGSKITSKQPEELSKELLNCELKVWQSKMFIEKNEIIQQLSDFFISSICK